ncbi:MAG: bacterial proteasome activator family protein [Actinobacteria bacterium]|nr:bacterial proteasome activator family protein [Actinomycetota bacterium]
MSDEPRGPIDQSDAHGDGTTASTDTVEPAETVEVVEESEEQEQPDAISEPGKLLRIALMLREMQEEVRRADPDEAGRQRLRQIHETSLTQMRSVLTGGLQEELDALTLPFDTDTPTESEIRIAQAQLIGWLEGLFQGIQAAIASQQMSARQQLERMRRQLPPGAAGMRGGPPGPQGSDDERPGGTGQYL